MSATAETTNSDSQTTSSLSYLIPKQETRVVEFLDANPQFDGAGVRIGILDTGVDPGAPGLQFLPDGTTPKLVDIVDCTGSGDVDVSTGARAELVEDGSHYEVTSPLSQRKLLLNKSWTLQDVPIPSDKKDDTPSKPPNVFLGLKPLYELLPKKLTSRLKNHRKQMLEMKLGKHIAEVREKLVVYEAKEKPTPEETKTKQDLQARLQALTDKEWRDNDPGPVYDVVVFFDGNNWRCVVDTSETGDIKARKPMTDFDKERHFETFGVVDQMNFGLHFYDTNAPTKLVSLVVDAGAHGSHVAGIAAASMLAKGKCGVAPSAEIVSLKIGDTRIGSMETGCSLTRALIQAVKSKCDVINLSYGEGCKVPNRGRFVELARDLVLKHNIIFVSSAGNNGPGISTVGAPGGTATPCIGVGAFVSPEMMQTEYSMVPSELTGSTFTWSSVGPTPDGDNGVTIIAPGGAITSVPTWTLQRSQLMNGTSMSSPNACGVTALLLSACKAEGIPISPSRIQRALENTAVMVPNLSTLQQGWGMVQADKAYEYLQARKDDKEESWHFDVHIERNGQPRGVYLRQAEETQVKQTFTVSVNPVIGLEDEITEQGQKDKIEFEMSLSLHSTVEWVKAPEQFMLMNNGRTFKIEVDPTELPPGIHTGKVCASRYDGIDGVLFHVPITAIKTLKQSRSIDLGHLEFEPAEVKRYFIDVPTGATWMDVEVVDGREDNDNSTRLMVLHALQLLPNAAYRDFEVKKYYYMRKNETKVESVRVQPGITAEVSLARYWSSIGTTKMSVRIKFYGVKPSRDPVQILAGQGGALVRLSSELTDHLVAPSAKLSKWKTPLRPKAAGVITPLGERDVIPGSNKIIYQLILTYEFTQEEAGSLTPRVPALQGVLYESAFESQLLMLFNGDKRCLGFSDAYPDEIKVPKGQVVIRLQVRHDDVELKETTLWLERKLDKDISLSVYPTKEAMMKQKDAFKKRTLYKGTIASVYFSEPAASKIPTSCKAGDVLFGTCFYAADSSSLPGDGRRPGGYAISFIVGPKPAKAANNDTPTPPEEERPQEEELKEAVRDLKLEHLRKLKGKEKEAANFSKLYDELAKEYPDHMPLLLEGLRNLDDGDRKSILKPIIEAADKVIDKIPTDEMAAHYGQNYDKQSPTESKERKEMDKKKAALTEALARKARAHSLQDTDNEKFEAALAELKKWVDIDAKQEYAFLVLERDSKAHHYGKMLAYIKTLLKTDGEGTKKGIAPLSRSNLLTKRSEVLKEMGYEALEDFNNKMLLVACPKSYAPF